MTDVSVSGLPAIAFEIGVMVLAGVPVWIAAKVVGAGKATLPRAIAAMIVGTIASVVMGIVGASLGGFIGILLAFFAFLFALKVVLETSMFGAFILSIISAAIYTAMGHLISSGISMH